MPHLCRDKQRYADDPHRKALSSYAWHKHASRTNRDGNHCVYADNGNCTDNSKYTTSPRYAEADNHSTSITSSPSAAPTTKIIEAAQRKAARLNKASF